jgi:uncharacterized protein
MNLSGNVGTIEIAVSQPAGDAHGVAVVAHPHPLFGGTMNNKVVTTLARSLTDMGWITARFNFRGIGASEGVHDEGRGETRDCVLVAQHMQQTYPGQPLLLAGFSFGGAVALAASQELKPVKLLMVAPAFSRLAAWAPGQSQAPSADTQCAIIHGDMDDTVPLGESLVWGKEHDVCVLVAPGVEHFFHQRLHHIKRFVQAYGSTT